MKVIKIIANKISEVKNVSDNYILQENESIMLDDDRQCGMELINGTWQFPPQTNEQVVKDDTIVIKKTVDTTQPQEVTVTDQTDHWNIKVVRNITSQVVGQTTYYTYEYIESTAPKDERTQAEIQAVATSRKNDFFARTEYPITTIYDDTRSATDLMKINFALMDKIDSLTQRVSTLEGGH